MDILRRGSVSGSSRLMLRSLTPTRLVVCLVVLLAACSGSHDRHDPADVATPPPTAVNTTAPHWVYQATPHSKVAVVFVHGIFGDTVGTWTHANGMTFFKLLKDAPDVGKQVDVYAFGFESNMFKDGPLNIRDAAGKLEDYLKYAGVWDYPTVVFVAHSMGGLVVMRELVERKEHLKQVPLLVFYATPQEGSAITGIARHVVNNPAISQMLLMDGNEFLQGLNSDWHLLPNDDRPAVICARETAPTYGEMIVPFASSSRFCDDTPKAIGNADHLSIVKPDGPMHPSVIVLVNALKDYVFGWAGHPLLSTPDFVAEGDHWVYTLTDPNGKNVATLVNNGPHILNYAAVPLPDLQIWRPDEAGIPAKHTGALVLSIRPATIRQEYRFTLEMPLLGDRQIVVRVPDVPAVQAKQDAVLNDIATQMTRYLSSPHAALTKEQQSAKLADIAGEAYARASPDLPPAAKWVMTADALASLGLNDLADSALLKATQASPTIVHSVSARLVASAISAQSGKPNAFQEHGLPMAHVLDTSPAMRVAVEQAVGRIKDSDLHAWSNLSDEMQSIPSLQSYGLSLKGDVLKAQGNVGAARKAYIDAGKIRSSPLIDKKIEAVKLQEVRQAH